MKKFVPVFAGFLLLYAVFGFQSSASQEDASGILKKNMRAASAGEALKKTHVYSYQTGQTRVFVSTDEKMKMMEGTDPVITEVVLVDGANVRRNCFSKITEIEGFEKARLVCMMKLQSGLFTLENFAGDVTYEGLKRFGPEQNILLKTAVEGLEVEFYLDDKTYHLKRMFLSGRFPSGDLYEVNYDFGPFETVQGITIPLSWFSSQVGTRGNTTELENVSVNPRLPEDFYSDISVNAGEVAIEETGLKGNIITFSFRRGALMIETNWTGECMAKAGIEDGDSLMLHLAGKEIKLDYYASSPPRSAYSPGNHLMIPNRRGENYMIYLISPEFENISEKLELLMPIRVKKGS